MTSLPWYHKTTIYQIYPRSFYDSNNDGIGDIPGIIQKLDYLQWLGVETLWISPFFASPQADFGYDISDYIAIAPEYGTMEDSLLLIEEVHRRGMRVLFDLVMNHTSIEHVWFQESRSSRNNSKADWYIWRDRPNNWKSVIGGSGWHYAKERKQYYLASFLPFQPDLNYRNPEVKRAMLDITRYWLEKGVDGFRLDIFHYIFKDPQFRNNPFAFKLLTSEDDPSGYFQEAKYTVNLPENFEFAEEFRKVSDEFGERLSIGEVRGSRDTIRKYLGAKTNSGLALAFDFAMIEFQFDADYFHNLIKEMEEHYLHPFMPVYVFSNHDRHRSIHRLEGQMRKAKLLSMLQLTVRGVPCIYYGEEIGMTDAKFPFKTALDPIPHRYKNVPRFVFDALGILVNRDEVRTPMQWDDTKNSGFSNANRPWLPTHKNYQHINVKLESQDENSLLSTIRSLLNIRRREPVIQEGSLELLEGLPQNVLGYRRRMGSREMTILLNFDESEKEFQMEGGENIFELAQGTQYMAGSVRLGGYGGLILKMKTS